jgi:hypothetical protein
MKADASSTCLECHAGYGQLTDTGTGYGSAGDFYWLKRTWTWTAHGRERSSPGDSHGHNIIAADFGLPNPDQTLSKAPGGSFSSANLSCASCHDPHGKGNAPLILRNNTNYNGAVFPAAPEMIQLSRRTQPGDSGEVSDTNHPVYGAGMSAWCAACHTTFDDGLAMHMHPTDQTLGTEIANNYNQYISTSDPTGNVKATAYLELVPFEINQPLPEDEAARDALTQSTEGADAGSKVACITCHRAHATARTDAARWDFTVELLVDSHPQGAAGHEPDNATAAEVLNSYYGDTIEAMFGAEQRSLCNKCHAQDGGLHG